MQGFRFIAEGGVTKIPGKSGGPGSEIVELDAVSLAKLVGPIDVNVGIELSELKLEDPHVAVGTGVVGAPCIVCRGKVIHATTARTYRLIYSAVGVEPGGATVYMFIGKGAAEVGGIDQVCSVGGEDGQVEVTAVCARLERAVGQGQPKRCAARNIGGSAVGVGLTAPPTDVHLLALAHEEGSGANVDVARARSEGGLPSDVTQVFNEAGDVLSAARIGVNVS